MMERINTVLATLDLQAGSDAVLVRTVRLASMHAAWLVVPHVIDAEPVPATAAHMNLIESELHGRLEQQTIAAIEAQLVENDRTRRTDVRVAFGSPHEVITHVTREQHAGVVVVGPGTGRTLKDKILGSTADRSFRMSFPDTLFLRNSLKGEF